MLFRIQSSKFKVGKGADSRKRDPVFHSYFFAPNYSLAKRGVLLTTSLSWCRESAGARSNRTAEFEIYENDEPRIVVQGIGGCYDASPVEPEISANEIGALLPIGNPKSKSKIL
jgi:hypothetical protein